MKKIWNYFAIIGAFVFALLGHTAIAQDAPPLSAYGALPDVEDAAISPSGRHVAILLTSNGVRQIAMFGPDKKLLKGLAVRDAKVRYFDWIGDDQLLLVTSRTEDLRGFTTDKAEFSFAQLIPVTFEGETEVVFGNRGDLVDSISGDFGRRKIDGRWTAFFGAIELAKTGRGASAYSWKHGRPFLYEVDALSNKASVKATAAREGEYRDWLIDARGEIAATLDLSSVDGSWKLKNGSHQVIASGNEVNGRVGLIGLGYNGETIIYSERDEENIAHWREIPLSGGNAVPFLDEADVERLYWDETTGHLVGYLDAVAGPVFHDSEKQNAARKIRSAFKDFDLRLMDWTPDFQKVLVRTSGNLDSGTWYIVDLSTGQAAALAYERPLLGPELVGEVSTFPYTATDGLEMDGILTIPPGREAKDLPVVVLPHGGPHLHDDESFDWWAQAFASRGYAVFQPNFRGSTNRDQAFTLAGYGQWGRKMQTDISDGVAALAEAGIVNPDRTCIVGASYGGYAALAGVTLQQGLYRCAVAVAPVSDIDAIYREDYRASGERRITKRALLDQLGPREGWDAVSPRRYADRADAPIMLIHGVDDTVVPYSHSHKMADALKDAGKPYELVTLKGEDHWLSLSETRQTMLEAAVGFVETHNPAD